MTCMIKTGYFAKQAEYASKGFTPVGIALYKPKWFAGETYGPLCPTPVIFQIEDKGVYERAYYEHLLELDADTVVAELMEISGGKPLVLMCYERPGDFCHRQIVRDWLQSCGHDVEEFRTGIDPQTPTLF